MYTHEARKREYIFSEKYASDDDYHSSTFGNLFAISVYISLFISVTYIVQCPAKNGLQVTPNTKNISAGAGDCVY